MVVGGVKRLLGGDFRRRAVGAGFGVVGDILLDVD